MDDLSKKIIDMQQFFINYIDKEKLPGVTVSVRQGGQLVWEQAFGIRDDRGSAMTTDTMFGIASMSKGITCAALARLEAEGRVSFLDPAIKYFPTLRIKNMPPESLLLHHLATHSSGIPPLPLLAWSLAHHNNEVDPTAERLAEIAKRRGESTTNVATIDDIIEYIRNGNYEHLGQPGAHNSYSNDSFALLSSVVDQAAGMPIEQYLLDNIFKPLNMHHSILDQDGSEAAKLGTLTELFSTKDGQLRSDTAWDVAPPYRGCGWVKSTAGDMARFYETLCDSSITNSDRGSNGSSRSPGKLPGAQTLYGSRFAEMPYDATFCYGLMKRPFHIDDKHYYIVEHAGGLHGVSSKGGFVKGSDGISAAVLCNMEDVAITPLLNAVFSVMLGYPPDSSHFFWPENAGSPIDPAKYVGRYHQGECFSDDVAVELRNGALYTVGSESTKRLSFCGTTKFVAEEPAKIRERWDHYRFIIDEHGTAKRLCVGSRVYTRLE